MVSTSGEVAFQGGPPVREVPTDALGAIRTVWVGDFTPLRAPGRYQIVTDDGISSYPFDVGTGVFDSAVRAVQRAFYYQRAFTEIDAGHAQGPWVHASDAALAPPGVVKGWHDAGDFSLYSASTNSALFWLLSAVADFSPREDDTGIPESGNGVPDLLDEARWGLEWLLSVQEPGGGFHNTTCQERYGPYGTNWPERMSPYRAGEVGTIATGRAVGTLAFASVLYRPHDAAFAERCLEAARAGYRFLRDRPAEDSDGPTCPAMRQDGDPSVGRDVRMYAAAGLLLATGDRRLRVDFEESYQPLQNDPSYLRSNVYAALLYLRASAGDPERQRAIRRELRRRAEEVRLDGERHPFQWAGRTLLGLHRGRLPADRRLQRPGLPGGPGRGGRRLRAGAGQRAPCAGPELPADGLRERPARRHPRADPRLPSLAGGARRQALPLSRAGGWRPHRGTGAGRRRRAARPPHSDLGLLGRSRHATGRLDATGGALYRQR